MKHVIGVLWLSVLLGCKTTVKEQPSQAVIDTPQLMICVIDYSETTSLKNKVNYWDSAIARNVYLKVANSGYGEIRIVGITSNSLKQEVLTIEVPKLDTIEISKNIYGRTKDLKANEEIKRKYNEQIETQISRLISLTDKPHDEQWSDAANSLLLVKICSEQAKYEKYSKTVILCTDLLHDVPDANSKLVPVDLPVRVICVRPAIPKSEIATLFPQSTIDIVTSTNDITFSQTK